MARVDSTPSSERSCSVKTSMQAACTESRYTTGSMDRKRSSSELSSSRPGIPFSMELM